jgi:hypothetical protein
MPRAGPLLAQDRNSRVQAYMGNPPISPVLNIYNH